MNAAIWDAAVARDLRRVLFGKHLGVDTAALDDVAALRLYRTIADAAGKGEAFTLSPQAYAVA
jgi:hypothetical protein